MLECFASIKRAALAASNRSRTLSESGAKKRCALKRERKTTKNTIKSVPGVLSEYGRAEIEGSQMSESEKLADPKNEEFAVAPEPPEKRPIRVEITLMPTYKPSRK